MDRGATVNVGFMERRWQRVEKGERCLPCFMRDYLASCGQGRDFLPELWLSVGRDEMCEEHVQEAGRREGEIREFGRLLEKAARS